MHDHIYFVSQIEALYFSVHDSCESLSEMPSKFEKMFCDFLYSDNAPPYPEKLEKWGNSN